MTFNTNKKVMNRTSNKVAIGLMVLVALTLSMSFKASIFQQSGFVAPASADAKVNPVKGDAAATAAGKKLYDINCAVCQDRKSVV